MLNPQQPTKYDAVLGQGSLLPTTSVVLGGIAGVRHRSQSHRVEERIAALEEALRYGTVGIEILVNALQDASLLVQKQAYRLLQNQGEAAAQVALRHYDAYQLLECVGILRGHQGGITAVTLSEDGRSLVSAGRDAMLRVWALPEQEEVMAIPVRDFIYGIALSSNQRILTVKLAKARLQAWDLRTGQEIEPEGLADTAPPPRTISSVTVSPSRQRTTRHLVSGSQNTIKIWNLQTGRQTTTLRGHTSLVTAVAVALHSPLVASGSEDKTIRIWGIEAMGPDLSAQKSFKL